MLLRCSCCSSSCWRRCQFCRHRWMCCLNLKYVLFIISFSFTDKGAKYCDQCICLYVCMSACPLPYLKNHVSKFLWLWLLPSPDSSVIRYVLWMISCFHVIEWVGQYQRQHVYLVQFARWRLLGWSLPSLTASCLHLSFAFIHSLHATFI